MHELGPELPAESMYELNQGDCLDVGTPDHMFPLGAELPLSEFPFLQTVDVGGARLRARYVSSSSGTLSAFGNWFDTTLGETCTPRPFPDGVIRCVPDQISYPGRYFADDACTVELHETYGNDVCSPLPSRLFSVDAENTCDGQIVQQVLELSSYDGDVYTFDGSDCVPTDPAVDGNLVFELGDEIPPEELVAIELVER
jgi:hypothetical protein